MKKMQIPTSMKLASVWAVWTFLAVGSIGWALFVVLNASGAIKDAAAWVQAFGAIFAIIMAVWIASSQSRQLQIQQHRKDVVLLKSLQVLSSRASRVCEGLINYEHANELSTKNLIKGLSKSFDDINILQLPDHRLIDFVCGIRDCFRDIQEGLVDEIDDRKKIEYANSRRLTVILATVMVANDGIIKAFNEINNSVSESHPEHVPLMKPKATSSTESSISPHG